VIWFGVLAGCLACYLLKLAGMSIPARWLERPRVQRIAALLPVALLAALIAVQTFASGRHVVIDARLLGAGVAAFAVWRRWPFLVVVILSAASTALLRWVLR